MLVHTGRSTGHVASLQLSELQDPPFLTKSVFDILTHSEHGTEEKRLGRDAVAQNSFGYFRVVQYYVNSLCCQIRKTYLFINDRDRDEEQE
jgi:hypothetical protein